MKHPNPECQKKQDDFLKKCPESERGFHEKMFRIGNAAYKYHGLAVNTNIDDKTLKLYYLEWLEGLPANIRLGMENRGFEGCKTVLSFTRYVNERTDIGMDAWMKEHLSEEDYKFYQMQGSNLNK